MNSEIVVVLRGDNTLTALDIDTGNTRWEHILDADVGLPYSRFLYDLDEERLVIAVNKAQLLALDIKSGQKIWQRALIPAAKTTPNVKIIEDAVVVSAFSTQPYTEGNVASYQLDSGEFMADIDIAPRTFQYQFSCPSTISNSHVDKQRICVTLHNRLLTIDSAEEFKVIETDIVNLYSLDFPFYQAGFIFSNPSPFPAPQVFDIQQNREFSLFAGCSRDNTSHPVTSHDDLILVSTGCNELYIMSINRLEQEPNWIFSSNNEILSSFVTIDGETGYALNAKGEIIGANLANGEEIGRIMTEPNQLEREQFRNNLTVNPPYLYALMKGKTLLVFKQDP
jgi:outer membrane protein assembly factor BamB